MHATDRDDLKTALTSALGMYDRELTDEAIDTWMATLRVFDLHSVRQALREHMEHPDEGKRPPRPVDVWRRLSSGGGKSAQCAAVSIANGRCQYPGVFSDATDGSGPWHCPWHRQHRTGTDAERFIEASKAIDFPAAAGKRIDRMTAESCQSPYVLAIRDKLARKPAARTATREPGQDEQEAA